MANNQEKVLNWLDSNSITYTVHHHEPILTVEEGQKIAQQIGSLCCKSLLVKNKKRYFLIVLESHKRFNSKEVAKKLESGHLSFASAEDLSLLMGTFPGAVSTLGLIFDIQNQISVVIDRDILKSDYVDCHPCTNDCSLKMSTKDLLEKVVPTLHKEPIFLDLDSDA